MGGNLCCLGGNVVIFWHHWNNYSNLQLNLTYLTVVPVWGVSSLYLYGSSSTGGRDFSFLSFNPPRFRAGTLKKVNMWAYFLLEAIQFKYRGLPSSPSGGLSFQVESMDSADFTDSTDCRFSRSLIFWFLQISYLKSVDFSGFCIHTV